MKITIIEKLYEGVLNKGAKFVKKQQAANKDVYRSATQTKQ